jgi:serine/threonine-protein kinase
LNRRLADHLDELLELAPEARDERLRSIAAEDGALAEELARLAAIAERSDGPIERLRGEVAAAAERGLLAGAASGAPPERLGAWRLTELLGRGGMGEVWRGERSEGGFAQQAAIKIVRAGMASEGVIERFRLERQLLARLEHPAIAKVYDGGIAPDGRPWFAMELVAGLPIIAFAQRRALATRERLELLIAVAEAVDVAHRSLVVHRDLKPSNVLVDADGRPKLLDFGLAKLLEPDLDPGLTRTEMRALTPSHAAPEQVLGEPVTTATDVYALGVLLYELLTGELPHRRTAPTAAGLAEELSRETVERPSSRLRRTSALGDTSTPRPISARELEGDLDTIVLRALAREPARRYPSAAAFADDLRRALDGRPVAARPDSAGYRLRKFVGRHRVGVAASALVVATLIAGLAVSLLQAERARREARRAERVRELLASLFARSTPQVSSEKEVTASALLEEGARRIDSELAASEPAVAAELLATISTALVQLGRLDEASRTANRAVELLDRLDEGGEASASVASRALRAQADAYIELRRHDEAIAAGSAAVERARAGLGASHLETAWAERTLALAFNQAGRHAEALPLDEHVLAVFRAAQPPDEVRVAEQLDSVGSTYDWLDRTEEAIAVYREAIAILERRLGAGHARLAGTLDNLGVALMWAGRPSEALPAIERAVAIRRATMPANHPWLAFTLNQYSGVLSHLDRLDESTAAAREMLAILRSVDPHHPDIPSALNSIATDEMTRGDFATAATLLDEALALSLAIGMAPDDSRRLQWLANSGRAETELGRLDTAELRLAESLAGRKKEGEELANYARSLTPWGTLLRLRGRLDEAIAAHRQAFELVDRTRSPTHDFALLARLELAQDLLARRAPGDVDEAVALATVVVARWTEEGPADRPRILDAELVLARAELLAGEREAARGRLERLEARQLARRGPASLPLHETRVYLAAARGASAASALARYAELRGAGHWAVARIRAELR